MLGKLFKHELKATGRIIPFVYFVTAFLIFLVYVSKLIKIDAIAQMGTVVSVLGIISCVVLTFVLIIIRYYKSMFTNEGYLTNTLPVKGWQLVLSKQVTAYFWFLLSLALSFLMMFALINIISDGKVLMQLIESIMGSKKLFFDLLIFLVITFIIWSAYVISSIFFSITLANVGKFQKHGVLSAFLIYIILYIATEIINTIATLLIPIAVVFSEEGISFKFYMMLLHMDSFFSNTTPRFDLPIGSFIMLFVLTIVFFFISSRLVEKKTSVK